MKHDPDISRPMQTITVGIFVFMSLFSLALIGNDVSDIGNPALLATVIALRIAISGFILVACRFYVRH